VRRTLRVEGMVMVLLTVSLVLGFTQWVNTTLSQHALEHDASDRALLAARVVDSLWDAHDWSTLAAILGALVGNHREIVDVDVLTVDGSGSATVVSTSGARAKPVQRRDTRTLEVPIHRAGNVVGEVRTEISLAPARALGGQLTRIDLSMLLVSVVALCAALAAFFSRRVDRPIRDLVGAMRAAEGGGLAVRAPAQSTAEFDYLVASFNRMLGRVENLAASLESRVRRATLDLATRNRELREANAHLRAAQLEAARSERFAALGEVAATLAHELGTPLNSVLGYAQMLRRAGLAAEHDAKLEIVESQVRRMIEIMRNLLDRTADSGARRSMVAVPALIADAVEIVKSRVESAGVDLSWDVADDVPPLSGDPVALRQMLVNLLVNAVDALPPFGTIRVSAVLTTGDGGRAIEIAVADDGPGIAPDHVKRIFEPFFTTKSPDRGTGLGLAIVQRVARAHRGSVAVESAQNGSGTTMRIRLPLEHP
jgi:two-component system NtrC family sensor kinase